MPRFLAHATISPAGHFGVPDDGYLVVPGRLETITSDSYHRSGVRGSYGTLPQFRADDEAVDLKVETARGTLHIRDNFANIQLEAEDHQRAREQAGGLLRDLLDQLSITQGRRYEYDLVLLEDVDSRQTFELGSQTVVMMKMTAWDTGKLQEELETAVELADLWDDTLRQATEYYLHAKWLQDAAPLIEWNRRTELITASVVLHLWKAVTTIVGDPSADKDFQSRYRRFGISNDFFDERISAVKEMRDRYDVAHARTEPDSAEYVRQRLGVADTTAREVLTSYRDWLEQQRTLKG